MRAALRPRHRVHLVEDHGLDAAQRFPPLRGEQQVERLGRRDEDVGRPTQHPLAVALRGVARAYSHDELRAQARERPTEVPLDVVVQGLQRGDVEEPQPLARPVVQPVDPMEERGERLARPGRRLHEHVHAGCDRGPGELLRGRRAAERPLEPGPRCRGERRERIHAATVATGSRPGRTDDRTALSPTPGRARRWRP